jgi:hypothetical protein
MKAMNGAADLGTPAVRAIFGQMGLDPAKMLDERFDDPERENRCLRGLLRWATAYRRFGSRQAMERNGFLFPPVLPGFDQDSDWLVFENWMAGRESTWRYADVFPVPPPAGALDDAAVEREYGLLVQRLATRNVMVALAETVPLRARYAYLRDEVLREPFEVTPAATTQHIDGCTGDCETCFQQPWCEMAAEFQEA